MVYRMSVVLNDDQHALLMDALGRYIAKTGKFCSINALIRMWINERIEELGKEE